MPFSNRSRRRWLIAVPLFLHACLLLAAIGCDRDGRSDASASKAEASPSQRPVSSETKNEELRPGASAPAFELATLDGSKRSLSDFRGKTILLNFWATWCGPCVSEMGALERLYKTHREKGFEVVGINVDAEQNDEGVRKFVQENGITFTILRDPELKMPEVYRLTGFPESFFIGPDGTLRNFLDPSTKQSGARIIGDRAWDAKNFVDATADVMK